MHGNVTVNNCMHGNVTVNNCMLLQLTGKHSFIPLNSVLLGAVPITGAFINYQWAVMIYDINCTGSEQTLGDCPHNGINDHLCQRREAASLICQSEYSELVRFT